MIYKVSSKLLNDILSSQSLLLSLFIILIFKFFINIDQILNILIFFILSFGWLKLNEKSVSFFLF